MLDVGYRRRVFGQLAQIAQPSGFVWLLQRVVDGDDVERNGLVSKACHCPEQQPMVVSEKIRGIQFVCDEIPGVVVEQ